MKKSVINILSIILLSLALSGTAQAGQKNKEQSLSWFISSTSHLLNRSSAALAQQHVQRGLYFADKALKSSLSTADELIAQHNLCIGYLLLNKTDLAADHCARAYNIAKSDFVVVRVRGALHLQDPDKKDATLMALSPLQIIVGNIQRQNPNTELSLVME